MKIADGVFLGGSTAEQQFNFSIPFLDVHGAHHGVKASFLKRATPYINALPVTAGGALKISIVQGIDDRGSMWTGEAFGTIDHQFR
jgi:hypothetical protein